MRLRRITILIDGDFFTRRLRKLVQPQFCTTPEQVADSARHLCKRHVHPMWQSIKDDLHEHVDGIVSAFPSPYADADATQ